MPTQMLFEQFLEKPSEAAIGALRRVPEQKRQEMVGLLAELMSRALIAQQCQEPAGQQPLRPLQGREGAEHE